MDNSYRFFENRECEFFPCHEGLSEFNCLFCYCPLYLMEGCPGEPEYLAIESQKEDGTSYVIKDCSNCVFPHRPENYDNVIKILSNAARKDKGAAHKSEKAETTARNHETAARKSKKTN